MAGDGSPERDDLDFEKCEKCRREQQLEEVGHSTLNAEGAAAGGGLKNKEIAKVVSIYIKSI